MSKPNANAFALLENEYESIQKSLTNIDENIKKITGKDPRNNRGQSFRFSSFDKRPVGFKRKLNYSPEYEDENFENKRSLQSQVVTSWESKHRDQVLEEQKNDKKSLSRNKRMFGLILGTLEKFKSDESHRKDAQKRAEIEQKLDQAAEEERQAVHRERERLFQERKAKRIRMKCLEEKLQYVQLHKAWEESHQYIGNFIQTKTKPHIFYMPAKHNHETEKLFQETKDKFKIMLAEKRAKLQKQLNEIDELYKKGMVNEENEDKKNGHAEPSGDLNKDDHNNNGEDVQVKSEVIDDWKINDEVTNKTAEKKESTLNEIDQASKTVLKESTEDSANPDKDDKEMAADKEFEPIYD